MNIFKKPFGNSSKLILFFKKKCYLKFCL